MEKVIGELDEPEMTGEAFGGPTSFEVFGDDRLGIVDSDDGNVAAAQRRKGVFGVDDGDIGVPLIEQLVQGAPFSANQFSQGAGGFESGPAADFFTIGFGIEQRIHRVQRIDVWLVFKKVETVSGSEHVNAAARLSELFNDGFATGAIAKPKTVHQEKTGKGHTLINIAGIKFSTHIRIQ